MKREIEVLKQLDIEVAYRLARTEAQGGLLRFMDMQFLDEVSLSDAQRLTMEMLYLRFSVNNALLRDLQCVAYQEHLFFDVKSREVYVSFSKLLTKCKDCQPVYMRLLDAAYERCNKLKDVSAYPRTTDTRYKATLLEISQGVLSVAHCVLPSWEVEKLYTSGLFRLLKVQDDVGVIEDHDLLHSQLTEYAANQAQEYLRIKKNIAGPTYQEWKKHRPACVACEYVVIGLTKDIQRVLQLE